jgi:NAD(P)H-hydrate epimerase
MAQGHSGFQASLLGAYINGTAGDMALDNFGHNFTATQLIGFLPQVMKT